MAKKWDAKSWAKFKAAVAQYEQDIRDGKIEEGPITEIIPAKRCQSTHFGHQCCGLKGHSGWHWCYREDGTLAQWNPRKNLKPWDVASSSTPPGHKSYIHPKDKAADYYVAHNKTKLVYPKKKGRKHGQET